ncbi:hypothetical protein UY3_07640 [Chelonia mydas]|uniref:Uncharacterized protein n=1 Tax=Chelonia mydas TaxID=8469 RepID=M7C427_CHEMY|nr:hypothetical protein UY3_07640 [Chelonia mydas]
MDRGSDHGLILADADRMWIHIFVSAQGSSCQLHMQLHMITALSELDLTRAAVSTPNWTVVILADISLMRVTKAEREQLLHVSGCSPGPYAASPCAAMVLAEVIADWCGKVSYCSGRNKAALPRNHRQRIAGYPLESFLEISMEDSRDILVCISKLFQKAHSA